jgi:1-acyl-sn-glycerol-3-phosphate acyltransferase
VTRSTGVVAPPRPQPQAPAPSRRTAEQRLLDVVARLLRDSRPAGGEMPAPRLDSSLERDLGIDSLARAELLLRIEREFDLALPERLLGEADTPRALLRAVLAGSPREARSLDRHRIEQPAAGASLPVEAATLVEAMRWHVERHPDRTHLVLLPEGHGAVEAVTYAQLDGEARAVAEGLVRRGVGRAEAIAIMLPTGRDFFRAFLGILMAGAVPVPIYPPARLEQLADHLRRQQGILDNCQATMLVTVDEGKRVARLMQGRVASLAHVASVDDLMGEAKPCALPAPAAGDLAMLQYTSGSTGEPKGVELTHANLLANLRAMGANVGIGPDDVFVSWLPLYHDMGLIGAWLAPLYYAIPAVVMSPLAFLNRPSRWPEAIHRYRGTISGGPNFAYEILATRVDPRDLEGLDLSSWRIAFNGAEPVSPDTLERFAARLAPCGLRRGALMPVYGLAECSVGLAFPPVGRGPRIDRVARASLALHGRAEAAAPDDTQALRFVACGSPIPGHELRVVGADGSELPERMEGRIEFRGPSATRGYHRNEAKTRELRDGEWLQTGDVGYVADGELFITSRAKDLIIRGGQHVHPYELEVAVGEIAGVRRGCVAVFGVADAASGTERVVVLAETRVEDPAARGRLRAAIAGKALALLGAPADDIVLAPPRTVLKTSSGKIRRAASRELYLSGLHGAAPRRRWQALAGFVAALAAARTRRGLRLAAQLAYGAWIWALGTPLVLLALAMSPLPVTGWHRRILRGLARSLWKLSGMPIDVRGLGNVPATGPAVIVSNHASYLDGPLLFALLERPVRFVAKRELAGSGALRRILEVAGVAWVERHEAGQGVEDAREVARHVQAGEAVVFFAEGTFTRAPGLRAFRMGPFVTAAGTGAPIVPVSLAGTRSILRDGQWLPRRERLRISIGEPLRAGGEGWAAAASLRDQARSRILAGCGEHDAAPGNGV